MKFSEKLTEGAGIALNYIGGIASIWFGGVCTLLAFILWGMMGINIPLALFLGIFGLTPVGGGIWLFRRGKIFRQLFKVKLQKEDVRRLAFEHQGRLTPKQLADHHEWKEEQALNILKNLAAEDPERIALELDYESGELLFEFVDIRRAIESQKQYQALPISETVGKKAVEIAMTLGKTIDTFHDYVEFTRQSVSGKQKQRKEDLYRTKIEQFLHEIDELKQQ